ncbi:translation initiation factor Sui1 [Duganella sp. CY15W]|uniref:translation initiation factor Sui1 n=1 Tax=Duganella sp. CY15W TaxID=2692172 RepID=UPI001368F253|nr:translation initiation factor Sui1 [Duganella sp. CY15W]MYM27345.1 translation initiation factor Sui1 [Duganella sp. CY15W]
MALVYSTETGRICPDCRKPLSDCTCKAAAKARPIGDGNVKVSRESKGRGGKTVTLVRGLPLDADALAALGKQLRSACGSGGTVKDGVLEIQGDHCERVMAELTKLGHKPKRVGG